jgi:hypothetical protein
MDEKDAKIREAIECCRPDSSDLGMPEMACLAEAIDADADLRAAHERIQQFDAHVARIFQDVPLPEGLEDRLLARLAREEGPASSDGVDSKGMAAIVDSATDDGFDESAAARADKLAEAAQPTELPPRTMFPFALTAGVAAVLALGIGLVVYFGMGTPEEPISREEFVRQATAAVTTSLDEGDWNPDLTLAPSEREFPDEEIAGKPLGWKHTEVSSLDKRAAAYLLSERIGSEVVLLVIKSREQVVGLKPDPPRSSLPTSGQQSVGAWQSNGYLYAVVVRGPDHRRRYIEILEPPLELAWARRKVLPLSLIGKL